MGTNFYAIPKLSRKEFNSVKDEINQVVKVNESNNVNDITNNIRGIVSDLEELIEDLNNRYPEIHLGKRSAGWQFLWEYHDGKYYKDNLESIKKFLSRDDIQIIDEYGKTFTIEQFFNDEVKDWLYKDDDHVDMDSYYQKHPDEKRYYYSRQPQWTSKDGLRFDNEWFS